MSKQFMKASLTRAIRTLCQCMVATIGTTATFGDVNWKVVLSSSLLATLLSFLTSMTGLPECDKSEEENIVE